MYRTMKQKVLVTGGTGFLGGALVNALVRRGYKVRVFDNNFRGHDRRLAEVRESIELVQGDIRDAAAVDAATEGMDWVFHLAFVNGTRHFYEQPGLVLDVGVRGALTTMDAVKRHRVQRYIVASSSEVYQEPTRVPTDESERIIIPDVTNPRFSYSSGKLITELLALHYLRAADTTRIIFRPHNVYGPDMGWEHVIPEFMRRVRRAAVAAQNGSAAFEIQGTGRETRAFCFVDDAVDGIIVAAEKGEDGRIYHVGVDEETTIADLAQRIGKLSGLELQLQPKALLAGSTSRRCPDISRLRTLGYSPKISLDEGLRRTWAWYQSASSD
jgi:nucleoside-diphosphate-sugar epimerase